MAKGRKPIPEELRRVPVGLLVDPATKGAIKLLSQALKISEGKVLDEAIKNLLRLYPGGV